MSANSLLQYQGPKRPKFIPGFQGLLGDAQNQGQFAAQAETQMQAPQIQAPQMQAPQQATQAPSVQSFTEQAGKGGNVVSPMTGKKVNPARAYTDYLAAQAPQEAMNFSFDNLPDARTGEVVQGLLGTAQQAGQDREQALQEVQELQARALAPNLDAETRAFFQEMADARRAEVESEFAPGGGISNQFERQGAANLASLANRGVIDSTTGAQTMARQNVDLAALRQSLLNQAAEQSRQDLLGERTGIRSTATQFGGLQGQLAGQAGQLQQAGLGTAGQLGLQGRQLESELQLAEIGQRLLGSQTALQNIQSLRNSRFNRRQGREMADLQRQLIESQLNGGGLLSTLGSAAGMGLGFAAGGPIGSAIGSKIGGLIGGKQ